MIASVEIAPDRDLAAVALAAGNGALDARRYADGRLHVAGVTQAALDAAAASAPVLAARRIVPFAAMLLRLDVAGRRAAAIAAIHAAPPAIRARLLVASEGIYADDAEARALLLAIGANPDEILA